MNKIKSNLEKYYTIYVLNEVSFHIYEKPFNKLSKYELDVLNKYLQRHIDIFPMG